VGNAAAWACKLILQEIQSRGTALDRFSFLKATAPGIY